MFKVVLDTNILISAIAFGGKPREILKQAIEGKIRLAILEPIIEEIGEVLGRDKFRYPASMIHLIIGELESITEFVEPQEQIEIIEKDVDDNRILECAVAFGADFIISGDNHLLELKIYNGIRIIRASDFLEEVVILA
jgi:putative PIN family toxin of toxin-antitoxin system